MEREIWGKEIRRERDRLNEEAEKNRSRGTEKLGELHEERTTRLKERERNKEEERETGRDIWKEKE